MLDLNIQHSVIGSAAQPSFKIKSIPAGGSGNCQADLASYDVVMFVYFLKAPVGDSWSLYFKDAKCLKCPELFVILCICTELI